MFLCARVMRFHKAHILPPFYSVIISSPLLALLTFSTVCWCFWWKSFFYFCLYNNMHPSSRNQGPKTYSSLFLKNLFLLIKATCTKGSAKLVLHKYHSTFLWEIDFKNYICSTKVQHVKVFLQTIERLAQVRSHIMSDQARRMTPESGLNARVVC